jgi:hypothetical protein
MIQSLSAVCVGGATIETIESQWPLLLERARQHAVNLAHLDRDASWVAKAIITELEKFFAGSGMPWSVLWVLSNDDGYVVCVCSASSVDNRTWRIPV